MNTQRNKETVVAEFLNAYKTGKRYFYNIDFRYQLTTIGTFAQAIVSEEIQNNKFKIKTDKPNVKVSWQVTGIRNDDFAKDNPIEVEAPKTGWDIGKRQYDPNRKTPYTKNLQVHQARSVENREN